MKLENLNDQLMAMAAFRYCLPRQSYIVGACLDWLRVTWDQFEQNTKGVIVRDIVEALMDNMCGSEFIDTPHWHRFAQEKFDSFEKQQQDWVIDVTKYKNKEWPLNVSI